MATILVPTDKSTIQDAIIASSPGDEIIVEPIYPGPESALVTVDNLKIEVGIATSKIELTLDAGITNLIVNGDGEVVVIDSNTATDITLNDGANAAFGEGGNDTIIGNNGNDLIEGGSGNDSIAAPAGMTPSMAGQGMTR